MIIFLSIMTSFSLFAVIYHHVLYPMLLSWYAKRHPNVQYPQHLEILPKIAKIVFYQQ